MLGGFIVSGKNFLKGKLNSSQKDFARKLAANTLGRPGLVRDLSTLAELHGSDKYGGHRYTPHYEKHFAPWRRKKINLLEIGVGGYGDPHQGGGSLRMWKSFFSRANIYGLDIHDKSPHDQHRIKTFKGSQVDKEFLLEMTQKIGPIDIIIDDGSHINEHIITTFKILFPLLKSPGIYVVEDLQTSYWKEEYGGSEDLKAEFTAMNFLKSLVDGLNFQEFTNQDYVPSYFDQNIVSIHFYHNLAFVYKDTNNEGSNILKKNPA